MLMFCDAKFGFNRILEMIKPALSKGTRDLPPDAVRKRQQIFNTVRRVFEKFGFEPIETPAIEKMSTLTGKYGEEGDRLIFKILNSGDYLSKVSDTDLTEKNANKLLPQISEKALRYDLTVPFARYVVQHRNDITFPFKRYQMQPVWRADRPQKGRYQEFYQCDADVIGTDSLIAEFDLVKMIDEVFSELGLSVLIKLNNRKVLSGIAKNYGLEERFTEFTVLLDKLDKIGVDGVLEQMQKASFPSNMKDLLTLMVKASTIPDVREQINEIAKFCDEHGIQGIAELNEIITYLERSPLKKATIQIDTTLARGLNYYTGIIIEVVSNDMEMGSICGGGRYDDLTGIFGMPDTSGVGISFGIDRIFDVMEELNAFQDYQGNNSSVLFLNFGDKEVLSCLGMVETLRAKGVTVDIFPDSKKPAKQMKYANAKNFRFVVMVGEEELENNVVRVKDMASGEQQDIPFEKWMNSIDW